MVASLAARAVEELARRIEALELEDGRFVARNTLQALPIDPQVKDFVLRLVANHRSKEGLLDCLVSLVDFLASRSTKSSSSGSGLPIRRFAVSKTDGSGGGHTLISVDEILYAFVGYAARRGIVKSSWSRVQGLRDDCVYVRTGRELYVTHYRSLVELRRRIDMRQFVSIHQSVLVNLQKITDIDFAGESKQVGVTVADRPKEWLVVSRRSFQRLRADLGLPPRQRGMSRSSR